MKNALSLANIALRGLMEFAIVLAFAFWGYRTGGTTAGKIGLAILAPAIGFGFWGLVDFRQAGKAAEVLRLLQELLLSGLAAAALYVAGQATLAWLLAALSVGHHALVYALGERLLKPRGIAARSP